jgi:hypothetical protein
MPTINFNNITKAYLGSQEVTKIYHGDKQIFPIIDPNAFGDPHWNNVILMLRGDGADNGTIITDSSKKQKTVLRSMGTAVTSTAQKKYGLSSIFFNGSSRITIADDADFAFGTKRWTIEMWIYPTATSGYFFGKGDASSVTGSEFAFSYGLNFGLATYHSGNQGANTAPVQTILLNQWQHLAIVRNSTTIRSYINGNLFGTANLASTSSINNTSQPISIGGYSTANITAYVDSFRITEGVDRYNANFNPETDTYLAY